MASRNFGNVKAAAVKRHPGGNVTGVTNFERPDQRSRRGGRAEGDHAAGLQGAAAPQRQVAARHATGPPFLGKNRDCSARSKTTCGCTAYSITSSASASSLFFCIVGLRAYFARIESGGFPRVCRRASLAALIRF